MTQKELIIQMYKEGKTGYLIAKELNKPSNYVYTVIKRYKLEEMLKQYE